MALAGNAAVAVTVLLLVDELGLNAVELTVIDCGPFKNDHEVEPVSLLLLGGVPVNVIVEAEPMLTVDDETLPVCECSLFEIETPNKKNKKEIFSKNVFMLRFFYDEIIFHELTWFYRDRILCGISAEIWIRLLREGCYKIMRPLKGKLDTVKRIDISVSENGRTIVRGCKCNYRFWFVQ
jgi:hypothetical protein